MTKGVTILNSIYWGNQFKKIINDMYQAHLKELAAQQEKLRKEQEEKRRREEQEKRQKQSKFTLAKGASKKDTKTMKEIPLKNIKS